MNVVMIGMLASHKSYQVLSEKFHLEYGIQESCVEDCYSIDFLFKYSTSIYNLLTKKCLPILFSCKIKNPKLL